LENYQYGKGTIACLTGAYFPASGRVPYACFDRDSRRAYLNGYNPGNMDYYYGVRSAVRA
jgi:hypothetical protein